jgi:hypothetical protein
MEWIAFFFIREAWIQISAWISNVLNEDFRISIFSSGSMYFKHRDCRFLPYFLCLLPTNRSISRCYII